MYTIIALGNPGSEYKNTRHNVAWILVDKAFSDIEFEKNKYVNSLVARVGVGEGILFVKPETFMNDSGSVISLLQKQYEIDLEKLVVVQDDIDLPLGTIRISYDRGSGGHNGIKSIIEHYGGKNFIRARVGLAITDEGGTLRKPDVLGNFSESESEAIAVLAPHFKKVIETIVLKGKEKTMNLYNQ
jgi:peptidyl-tRNA hydrolase, PTH1 family